MTSTIIDSINSTGISEEKALRINREVPDRLAAFFYVNKSKVSYYRKDAWGSLETWNKGSKGWEYCPGMNNSTLIRLPACASKEVIEASVEIVAAKTVPVPTLTSCVINTKVPTLSDLQKEELITRANDLYNRNLANGRRITDSKPYTPPFIGTPTKSNLPDINMWTTTKINSETLIDTLIKKYNVNNFPIKFVKGEPNYAFIYIKDKEEGKWQFTVRVNYMYGAVSVTSKTCAIAVVKELNDRGITPDQV